MIYIACLLTGKWPEQTNLGEAYVHALYGTAQHFAPRGIPWRFVCFSDKIISGVPTRPVPNSHWGWFNKAFLFSREAFPQHSRVLYLDLDTAIVGDWSPFVAHEEPELVALRNVWGGGFGSGIMGWGVNERYHPWWTRLSIQGIPRGMRTDEQWFVRQMEHDGIGWRAWEDVAPGRALNYKAHIMGFSAGLKERLPFTPAMARAARIIYFHGSPRPHDVNQKWNPIFHQVRNHAD